MMSNSSKAVSRSPSDLSDGISKSLTPSLIKKDIKDLLNEGDEEDIYVVGRALLRLMGEAFKFTKRAIWVLKLDQTNSTIDTIKTTLCMVTMANLPDLEHWAFAAKGEAMGNTYFFLAQFGQGDRIDTEDDRKDNKKEKKDDKFQAILVQENMRHAALMLCNTKANTNVFVRRGRPRGSLGTLLSVTPYVDEYEVADTILEQPGGRLVADPNSSTLWENMAPHTLSQMNELLFNTKMTGTNYEVLQNNCQCFAKEMYRLTSD